MQACRGLVPHCGLSLGLFPRRSGAHPEGADHPGDLCLWWRSNARGLGHLCKHAPGVYGCHIWVHPAVRVSRLWSLWLVREGETLSSGREERCSWNSHLTCPHNQAHCRITWPCFTLCTVIGPWKTLPSIRPRPAFLLYHKVVQKSCFGEDKWILREVLRPWPGNWSIFRGIWDMWWPFPFLFPTQLVPWRISGVVRNLTLGRKELPQ